MTRTRTQTTLTKLAEMVANVHGELAFLEGLANTPEARGMGAVLEARRVKLVSDREALHVTIRQFDPNLEPETIGPSEVWRKQYGKGLSPRRLVGPYMAARSPKNTGTH